MEARAGLSNGSSASRLAETTDEMLVGAALDGDRASFEQLVRRHQRALVNHLYRQVGRTELARDLAQEAFLKVYLSLDRFDPRFRFRTWLYRIASNCAIDHLRKKRPVEGGELSAVDLGPSPDDLVRARELKTRIEDAVGRLPAELRQLVLLRHRLHCRYDEIARITDLPIGTVKNRIFRARQVLRVELADLLEGSR